MPEVFVNYRTGDGEQLATIIDQDLRRRFGDAAVFKDHRSIQAGAVFQKALENGVWGSKVLLCVIGPAWLTAADGTGRRKIDNPEDWIHRELVMAFDHGVRVIPVIDEQAQSPLPVKELPQPLKRLADLQYKIYHHRDPDTVLNRIAQDVLDSVPGLKDLTQPAKQAGESATRNEVHGGGIGGVWGDPSIGTIISGPGNQYNGDVFGGSQFNGPTHAGTGTFNNARTINVGKDDGSAEGEERP